MPRNKYRAVKTEVDGITFDSKAEAKRYVELKLLEKQGLIQNLELQPKFDCVVNDTKVCTYRADFRYLDPSKEGSHGQAGCTVVEDVKGYRTAVYKLKKRLVEALFRGVKIMEVTK